MLKLEKVCLKKMLNHNKFGSYVWTIRDVKKRNIAKENNLNYIEFFTILELETWLKEYNGKQESGKR